MDDEQAEALRQITRRQALRRGVGGALAISSLSALLAACGGSDDDAADTATTSTSTSAGPPAAADVTGALTLLSYPGWYGPKEFADFEARYPGASVKSVASGSGAAQQIAKLARDKGSYDVTLAGVNVAEQMKLAGLLDPFDPATVPNVKGVGAEFVEAFPYGIPTDFGRTGFAYRKDLIKERPTTWEELWSLAAKYSGKTTMIKYDADIQGTALKLLGYSVNTKDDAELDAMQKKLLELKPHLRAIIDTDFSKQLLEGSVYFAIDYDYDIATARASDPNVVWVQPDEGVAAYLEGWIALKDSAHMPAALALMDFHLEPKNYASFINATGTAYTYPPAEPYIEKAIAENPILKYTPESLEGVDFELFLGAEQTAARGKLWEAFLAA